MKGSIRAATIPIAENKFAENNITARIEFLGISLSNDRKPKARIAPVKNIAAQTENWKKNFSEFSYIFNYMSVPFLILTGNEVLRANYHRIFDDSKSLRYLEIPSKNLPGKRSQKGRLDTIRFRNFEGFGAKGEAEFRTVIQAAPFGALPENSIMRTVYENGELYCSDTLERIRERSNGHFSM